MLGAVGSPTRESAGDRVVLRSALLPRAAWPLVKLTRWRCVAWGNGQPAEKCLTLCLTKLLLPRSLLLPRAHRHRPPIWANSTASAVARLSRLRFMRFREYLKQRHTRGSSNPSQTNCQISTVTGSYGDQDSRKKRPLISNRWISAMYRSTQCPYDTVIEIWMTLDPLLTGPS